MTTSMAMSLTPMPHVTDRFGLGDGRRHGFRGGRRRLDFAGGKYFLDHGNQAVEDSFFLECVAAGNAYGAIGRMRVFSGNLESRRHNCLELDDIGNIINKAPRLARV